LTDTSTESILQKVAEETITTVFTVILALSTGSKGWISCHCGAIPL